MSEDTISVELTQRDVLVIDGCLNAAIPALPEGNEVLLDVAAVISKLQWAIHEQKGVALDEWDPR